MQTEQVCWRLYEKKRLFLHSGQYSDHKSECKSRPTPAQYGQGIVTQSHTIFVPLHFQQFFLFMYMSMYLSITLETTTFKIIMKLDSETF